MTRYFACQTFVTTTEFFDWQGAGCAFDERDDVPLVQAALDTGSDILMLASDGRVHGVCIDTVRPLGEGGCWPLRFSGDLDLVSGYQGRYDRMIPLRGPNTKVISVVIDGVVLSPAEYGLVNGEFLYRVNGSWPSGSLDPDDFEVTYSFGRPADLITKNANLELGLELASFYVGGKTKLSAGVTSANIQGAAIALRDAADEVTQYLPRVGAFLAVYAPKGINQSGGVWSPELDHGWDLVRVEGPDQS